MDVIRISELFIRGESNRPTKLRTTSKDRRLSRSTWVGIGSTQIDRQQDDTPVLQKSQGAPLIDASNSKNGRAVYPTWTFYAFLVTGTLFSAKRETYATIAIAAAGLLSPPDQKKNGNLTAVIMRPMSVLYRVLA